MSRPLRSAALALALLAPASMVQANDMFSDLFRSNGSRDPAGEYREDTREAQQDYAKDAQRAQETYYRDVRSAEQRYQQARNRSRDPRRDYDRYREDYGKAGERYQRSMSKAQQDYYRDMEKAKQEYYRNMQRYQNDRYRDNRTRQGPIWDRADQRRHEDEWRRRGRYQQPVYGYDHGDYRFDREIYGRYDHSQGYNRGQVTYWQDGRGGTGYYRQHEDDRLGQANWNLSVDFGVPGGHGYVNNDPYTYSRGNRYPQNYYRGYMDRDNRLSYNNQPHTDFQLAAGSDYYGDRYLYGNLHIVR